MRKAQASIEKFLALMCCLLTVALAAESTSADCAKPKPIYKIIKLSLTEVGISCLNGADPTGKKVGNVVIMSCGKETKNEDGPYLPVPGSSVRAGR